jgi:GTPase
LFFERPEAGRRAVLLSVTFKGAPEQVLGTADECAELARSAGVDVVVRVGASRTAPHPRWYVGEGKLEELADALAAHDAGLLVVNHDLSPGQQRNLEKRLGCRAMTRTELILHIFADRARTYEGKLQVELAQLSHAQTRLVRGWTHLDRQKGGIGLRGAGETQLELDQRMLAERLRGVRSKLATVQRRRGQGRRRRQRGDVLAVSLVGYTNAGKSTLFNALTEAGVSAEDKLFATLDPTMRKLDVPGLGDVVLADTVGFISHLPHSLVEAFNATLEEVASADLLLHVVDASSPDADARIRDVDAVLDEIGAAAIPTLMVLNKIDAVSADLPAARVGVPTVAVSARTGAGLERLIEAIGDALGVSAPTEVHLAASDGATRAWLYGLGAVIGERVHDDGGVSLTVRADARLLERLARRPVRSLARRIAGQEDGARDGFVAPLVGHP